MPIALEANRKPFPVVLKSDAEKPEGQRPTFLFRVLTCREFNDLTSHDAEGIEGVLGTVCKMLVGWERMVGPDGEIPYDPEKLQDLLTPSEAKELLLAAIACGVTEDDRKN
jgi:hypothetical protein